MRETVFISYSSAVMHCNVQPKQLYGFSSFDLSNGMGESKVAVLFEQNSPLGYSITLQFIKKKKKSCLEKSMRWLQNRFLHERTTVP